METMMPQLDSRNDLPSNAKTLSIAVLNARLVDAIDLALLTKQAHWNLKGPSFIAVHEMLDGFRGQFRFRRVPARRFSALAGHLFASGDLAEVAERSKRAARA
jgi:starvation-inducible DNA-binding protein